MSVIKKGIVLFGIIIFGLKFFITIALLALYNLLQYLYAMLNSTQKEKSINPFNYTHPDVFKDSMDMISFQGFKIEEYKFMTDDEYTIVLWRLINLKKNITRQEPVLLQHGLLDCSISWFLHENKNNALPYILSQQGYDVWIGNNRGTKYSMDESHKNGYWDYTFDQLVQHDVPTMISGILQETKKQKLIYIGHSQGSTQLFAALTQQPQLKQKLKAIIALGPVISLGSVENHLIINLSSRLPLLEFYKLLGFNSFLHLPAWMNKCVAVLIYNIDIYFRVFHSMVNLFCGEPVQNKIDIKRLGVIIAHEPGGSSVNNLLQWVQSVRAKQFRKFDYGNQVNKIKYGNQIPPKYEFKNLQNLDIKKYLFRGTKDSVISDNDYNYLLSCLDKKSTHQYNITDYAHLDYIWSTNAHVVLYPRICEILEKQSTTVS